MKKVFQSNNYLESQIVLGMLQSDGFNAVSAGNFLIGGVGELPVADLYIIRVPEGKYSDAKQVVIDYENDDLEFESESQE